MLKLLTPRELAEMLGIAEQTIYNRHSTGGDLPTPIKLGKSLRFRLMDVEHWIAEKVPPIKSQHHIIESRPVGRPSKAEQIAKRKR